MLGIMAGMTQLNRCLEEYLKIGFFWEVTSYVSLFCSLIRQWMHVTLQRPGLCSELQKTAEILQLQFIDGRRFSCRNAQADSHGLAVQQTMVSPLLQFLCEVIDDPGMQSCRYVFVCNNRCPSQLTFVVIFSWRRGCFPWSDCSSRPSRFPYCFLHGGRCPCCGGRAYPLSWRRGRFTWSRLLVGP